MADKPRYPASVFAKLKKYPIKHCRFCGGQLTPKLYPSGLLEPAWNFKKREYCDRSCRSNQIGRATDRLEKMNKARAEKRAERVEVPKQQTVLDQLRAQLPPKQKTSPPAKPVQQAKKEASGRNPKPVPKVVHSQPVTPPKPPTQTPYTVSAPRYSDNRPLCPRHGEAIGTYGCSACNVEKRPRNEKAKPGSAPRS